MWQRFRSTIHTMYGTARGRRLLSVLLAACCMLLTYALFKVTFLNNDDTNIMYTLAGYRTGAPYPTHRFINVLLGLAVSALYRAMPSVPWWAMYQIAMLFVSIAVINACVLRSAHRSGVSPWAALLLVVILYAGAFVYTVAWMTFTLTAAMLGTASTALLLTLDAKDDAPAAIRRTVAAAIGLLLLCFFTRNSSGYSMLCFAAAAALYRFLCARGVARARVAGIAAIGAALVAIVVAVNSLGVSYYNPAQYRAFETARGHFIDYPHAAYGDDPAFFEAYGWDETAYALADNLCYIDPVVDATSMEAAAAHRSGADGTLPARLIDTLQYGVAYFRGSGVSQYLLMLPVLFLLLSAVCYAGKRRGFEALFIACATAAGAFALCFYLCYKGRFPVRTFMLIALPTALFEALLMLRLYGANERRFLQPAVWRTLFTQKSCRRRKMLYAIASALVTVTLLWSLTKTQIALFSYDKSERVAESAAVERYVIAHRDNVYITDVTSVENIAAFTVYPNEKPVNLIDWGGTSMHSGWKNAQLAVNGLTELSPDMFRRRNVYFITEREGDKLNMLYAYLEKHAGVEGYARVDQIAGELAVYRFRFSDAGEARP